MRILGIDPGLQVCGYAVLDKNSNAEKLLEAGIVRTDSSAPIELRLNQVAGDFQALIKKFRPGLVAVEELYSHYAHPRTAILMGHARGVILQTASAAEIEVRSFSATRIKKAITGNGRASKMQIQKAIMSLLGLRKLPEPADIADAIAAALCCANEL
jgi:crossover junction endodeoxyribonuclease RuvC